MSSTIMRSLLSPILAVFTTIVNRYLDGAHFLSLNTGGNMAYEGYKGIAEYMLRHSKRLKYIALYVFPQLVPAPEVMRVGNLGSIVYDALVGIKSRLTPPTAFLSPHVKAALFPGDNYNADQLLQYQPSAVRLRLVF